jgi:hypothetical protein
MKGSLNLVFSLMHPLSTVDLKQRTCDKQLFKDLPFIFRFGSFLYILVGKPEGNRPLGRPRRRWEESTGMNLSGNRVGV